MSVAILRRKVRLHLAVERVCKSAARLLDENPELKSNDAAKALVLAAFELEVAADELRRKGRPRKNHVGVSRGAAR